MTNVDLIGRQYFENVKMKTNTKKKFNRLRKGKQEEKKKKK